MIAVIGTCLIFGCLIGGTAIGIVGAGITLLMLWAFGVFG